MVLVQPRLMYISDGFWVQDPKLTKEHYIKKGYFKVIYQNYYKMWEFNLVYQNLPEIRGVGVQKLQKIGKIGVILKYFTVLGSQDNYNVVILEMLLIRF